MVRESYRVVCATIAVSVAFVLLVPSAARAEQPAAAKEAFEEASAEYALGHYTQALAKFELAFKLKHVPGLLFNIAQCHRQLKEFELAATTYRSFIRASPDTKQVAIAQQLLEQVEETLKSEAAAQTRPPTNLGHETTEGRGGDSEEPPEKRALTTVAAPQPATRVISAAASPRPAPLAAASPQPAHPAAVPPQSAFNLQQPVAAAAPRPRRGTWVAAGASIVAVGAGAVFGLQARSTSSSITSSQHPRGELDHLDNNLKSQASRANLLFGVGVGLAAVTAALFILRF